MGDIINPFEGHFVESHKPIGLLVCRNGHVVGLDWVPRAAHCPECGAEALNACPNCTTRPINGPVVKWSGQQPVDKDRLFAEAKTLTPPAYCHACGDPYPWTADRLEAAREVIDLLDGLKPKDRERLKASLEDLAKSTPRTEAAMLYFKQSMVSLAPTMKKLLYDVVVKVSAGEIAEQIRTLLA